MEIKIPFFNKGSAELQKIIANTGWLFADRLLRMGLGLFVFAAVARYLGIEQFGTFSYALSVVSLFGVLSTFGLSTLAINTITKSLEQKNQILGTIFILQLIGGCIALFSSILFVYLVKHNDHLTVSLVAILGTVEIFRPFQTIDLWFQSQLQSRYTVIANNVAFIVFSIFKLLLINFNASLMAFALATLTEFIVGIACLIVMYIRQGYSLREWRWNFILAKKLLTESFPLILSGMAITIYMKIDNLMLGSMVGNDAVGLYSSATKISEAWYFIPGAIVSSFAPSIYSAKKNRNHELYNRRLVQMFEVLTIISFFISVIMTYFCNPLILLLYGSNFMSASPILAIHIWASLFVFMGGGMIWFIAEGLQKFSTLYTILGALTNVILNLVLIPYYEGVGAAVATVISYFVSAFGANSLHAQTRAIFLMQLRSLFIFRFIKKIALR